MLFGRTRLSIFVTALLCLASIGQVTGSLQTIPPVWLVATLHDLRSSVAGKDVSMHALGGCGRGRFSNPQTHGCRGPADIQKSEP